jgi:hypothetical protein
MTPERRARISKAVAAEEQAGRPWTNLSIFRIVRGNYEEVAQVLKYHRRGKVCPLLIRPSSHPARLSPQEAFDRRVKMGQKTIKLIEFLETCQEGTFFSYAVINTHVGFNVQAARDNLMTARMYVLATCGLWFEPEVNKGLHCVTESGKLAATDRYRREAHNKHKKNMQINASIDIDALPIEDHPRWVAAMSIDSAVAIATDEKTVAQVRDQREPQPLLIDPRQYREVFQGLLAG